MAGTSRQLTTGNRPRVLVVDEDAIFAETIADGLELSGFAALPTTSSREAARRLEQNTVDALVSNLRMQALDGIELLAISRRTSPSRPVILMAEYGSVDSAIAAVRRGAYHYLIKPFLLEELTLFLERALEDASSSQRGLKAERSATNDQSPPVLVGSSAEMKQLRELIERVADASASLLISGETGTGKSAIARAIHARGPRACAPFLAVNCAGSSEDVLQHELFGQVQLTFSGERSTRAPMLERTNGGTLFLDEIAELPLPLQAMLLHVLESKTADLRVLAATRANLRERVTAGAFREDLVYRLDVVNVEVPPLRDRREDIPELVACFLASSKERHPDSAVEHFSVGALNRLGEYAWPGNVRELEHCVEHAVLATRSTEVRVDQLPPAIAAVPPFPAVFHGEVVPLREIGRRYVRWAYERLGGKKIVAAERLQIDNKTLNKMLLAETDDKDSHVTG